MRTWKPLFYKRFYYTWFWIPWRPYHEIEKGSIIILLQHSLLSSRLISESPLILLSFQSKSVNTNDSTSRYALYSLRNLCYTSVSCSLLILFNHSSSSHNFIVNRLKENGFTIVPSLPLLGNEPILSSLNSFKIFGKLARKYGKTYGEKK